MHVRAVIRWGVIYAWHVLLSAIAGSIPTVIYFGAIMRTSTQATLWNVLQALSVVSLFTCGVLLLPFCAFVAAPVAIALNKFLRLSLLRILGLSLVLTLPAILYLDYFMYSSSGPDSGPPTEPYSLAHLSASFSTAENLLLMVGIPMVSALMAAATLWHVRFART